MSDDNSGQSASLKKIEANRRNALRSTGPRTEAGKKQSRRNALRHGILTSALLITDGSCAEYTAEFNALLGGLRQDLAPVGTLEEMLVEKIAVCWWRQKRALKCEVGMVRTGLYTQARANSVGTYGRRNGPSIKPGACRDKRSPLVAFRE